MAHRRFRRTPTPTGAVSADPIGAVRDHDAALVPDDRAWGPGYATTAGYSPAELDEIAVNMLPDAQLGYSAPRLFAATRGYHRVDTAHCVIPAGHDAHGPAESPNRPHHARGEMDTAITTSTVDHQQVPDRLHRLFQVRGWVADQHGRPCHPWYEQLLSDQRIGLNTGIGYGYYWGEATVVDVALFDHHDQVLLVAQHSDPNPQITLALPGGYSRPADEARTTTQWRDGDRPTTTAGIYATARRRLDAETGVPVPVDAAWHVARATRPVSWPHTTLNFWITTYTIAVRLPAGVTPPARPGSGATWQRLTELDTLLPHLWPDHQRALTRAVDDHQR